VRLEKLSAVEGEQSIKVLVHKSATQQAMSNKQKAKYKKITGILCLSWIDHHYPECNYRTEHLQEHIV